jgi:hypothetical protein
MPFTYPISSVNQDTFELSGGHILVPDSSLLNWFYYIHVNPVSPGLSKMPFGRVAPVIISATQIELPTAFRVDEAHNIEAPLAARWWLGNSARTIDRAIEYKERVIAKEENITTDALLLVMGFIMLDWDDTLNDILNS